MLISPAKTLDFETQLPTDRYTQPKWLDKSTPLINILKEKSLQDIATMMSISDKLAQLNVARFAEWQPPFTPDNARPAIFAFMGDVYEGINAYQLDETSLSFAEQHLGILSGLYGLLSPLDLIQAYRLEMGTKLANPAGKDLYAYWKPLLAASLNQRLASEEILINLASEEYFKAIDRKLLKAKVIEPVFLDEKNGKQKIISFYAKRARGLMVRYAIEKRISDPEKLKAFDVEGYAFSAPESDEKRWVFKRNEATAARY